MDAATLHAAIAEVCPILGVSVGKEDDRSTWTFEPKTNATQSEIAAGDNVIATIPIDTLPSVATADFIGRFTNAEYLSLEKKRAADVAANKVGNAKNWDVVVADTEINFNKKKVQTLKTDLVADGILTQARADEIFS
jgi:hypothetical protein